MQKQREKAQMNILEKRRWEQSKIRMLLIAGAVALVILVLCVVYLYHYVNAYEKGTAAANLYIGETDVSNLTEKEIQTLLAKQVEEYAKAKVDLTSKEDSVSVTLQDFGLTLENVKELAKEAVSYGKKGTLWGRYAKLRSLKKKPVVLKEKFAVEEELAVKVMEEETQTLENAAKDATITRTNGTFVITEGTQGSKVDSKKSIAALLKCLNQEWDYSDLTLELVQEKAEPEITAADLETIQDLLGSFYTQAGSGTRVKNLRRGAELLNDTVVMPGEEVSVEILTKPYTLENGYVEGSAYLNGEIVSNIAGGICQVSTTLYNALLYAEVEITERYAHSMEVHYVDLSKDAAIAEGIKDLKFKNNYDTPIYIEGYIDGNNQLTFNIYGKETRPENRSVEYESEVLSTTKYKTKYVADNKNVIGYISKEQGTPMDGGTAKLWKVVYEDGKEVSREKVNSSTYSATTVTVKVGVKSEHSNAAKIVKSAIASQNKSTIKKAISQAKSKIAEAEQKKKEQEAAAKAEATADGSEEQKENGEN